MSWVENAQVITREEKIARNEKSAQIKQRNDEIKTRKEATGLQTLTVTQAEELIDTAKTVAEIKIVLKKIIPHLLALVIVVMFSAENIKAAPLPVLPGNLSNKTDLDTNFNHIQSNFESVWPTGEGIPYSSAGDGWAGAYSSSNPIPTGYVGTTWTAPHTFQAGILTSIVNSTAADGLHYGDFLNTVAYTGPTTDGVCFYSNFLPDGWYCHKDGVPVLISGGGTAGPVALEDITDFPPTVSATETSYLDGTTSNIQTQFNDLLARVSALEGVPTIPTLNSSIIDITGEELTIGAVGNLALGGGTSTFDVDCATGGDNITATYLSTVAGDIKYTLGETVVDGDTCNLDHVKGADGVEMAIGEGKLDSFSDMAVDNQSEYLAGGRLFFLDFESDAATDLAGGWTILQPAGSVNLDSTSGAISGLQSMYARNNSSGINGIISPIITPVDTVYYWVKWQSSAVSATSPHGVTFHNSSGTRIGGTKLAAGGVYDAVHGSVALEVFSPYLAWTTYYSCGKFTTGSGVNGVHVLNSGPSATPSENNTVTINTGTGTGQITQVGLMQYGPTGLHTDDYEISVAPIAACSGAGL